MNSVCVCAPVPEATWMGALRMSGTVAPVPVPAPGWMVPDAPATLLSVPEREDSPMVRVLATGLALGLFPIRREDAATRMRKRSGVPTALVFDDQLYTPSLRTMAPICVELYALNTTAEATVKP